MKTKSDEDKSVQVLLKVLGWMIVVFVVLLVLQKSTKYMASVVSGLVGCDIHVYDYWGAVDYIKFWFKSVGIFFVLMVAVISFVLGVYFYFKNQKQIASSLKSPSPKKWMVAGALLGAATSRGGTRRAARGALLGWLGHKMIYSGREAVLFGLILIMPYAIFKSIGNDLFCSGFVIKYQNGNDLQLYQNRMEVIPLQSVANSAAFKEKEEENLQPECIEDGSKVNIVVGSNGCRSSEEMDEIKEVVISSMKYSESTDGNSQISSSKDDQNILNDEIQKITELVDD